MTDIVNDIINKILSDKERKVKAKYAIKMLKEAIDYINRGFYEDALSYIRSASGELKEIDE